MSGQQQGGYSPPTRNQFDLLTGALDGLLRVLVDDPDAAVPTGKDPWEGAGVVGQTSGTGQTWAAINQARAVLSASREWSSNRRSSKEAPNG